MAKSYHFEISTPSGVLLKERWANANFIGFSKEINSGLSECVIELGVPFDYQGSELKEGNDVGIFISDKQAVNLLIYSGYISMYNPWIRGEKEGITVNLLGHYTKLALDILKNGTQTTLYTETVGGLTTASGDLSFADVGKVLKAVIDRYSVETASPKLSYTGETLKETGTDTEYIFELKTYREAIDKLLGMSPVGWWWRVDEFGLFHFKSKPTAPKHTFIFGKHFSEVKVERSMEKVRNVLIFWNGELGGGQIFKSYKKQGSINQYGRRVEKYFDWRIGDVAVADKIASRFLNQCEEPDVKVICEIVDDNEDPVNGYDIESIQPGDTCRFAGFNEQFADIFRENMLIAKVDYALDKVTLTIEVQKAGIVAWQEEINKKAEEYYSKEAPEIYTE